MKENLFIVERFTKTKENKTYKYMTSVSKSAFIGRLDDRVNKYENTSHSTIKMKPIDVNSNTYIKSSKKNNDKDPEFKIGGIVKISN